MRAWSEINERYRFSCIGLLLGLLLGLPMVGGDGGAELGAELHRIRLISWNVLAPCWAAEEYYPASCAAELLREPDRLQRSLRYFREELLLSPADATARSTATRTRTDAAASASAASAATADAGVVDFVALQEIQEGEPLESWRQLLATHGLDSFYAAHASWYWASDRTETPVWHPNGLLIGWNRTRFACQPSRLSLTEHGGAAAVARCWRRMQGAGHSDSRVSSSVCVRLASVHLDYYEESTRVAEARSLLRWFEAADAQLSEHFWNPRQAEAVMTDTMIPPRMTATTAAATAAATAVTAGVPVPTGCLELIAGDLNAELIAPAAATGSSSCPSAVSLSNELFSLARPPFRGALQELGVDRHTHPWLEEQPGCIDHVLWRVVGTSGLETPPPLLQLQVRPVHASVHDDHAADEDGPPPSSPPPQSARICQTLKATGSDHYAIQSIFEVSLSGS